MGTILKIRMVFITIRKLVLTAMKQSYSMQLVCTLLKRLKAFGRAIRTVWTKISTSGLSRHHSKDTKTIVHPGTTTVPFSEIQDTAIVSLKGVSFSLYPHSHGSYGSHGNSLTSLSHQSGIQLPGNIALHDFPNLEASGPPSILPTSTLQATHSSIHSQTSTQDTQTVDPAISISTDFHGPFSLCHPRIKPMMPENTSRYNAESRKYRRGQSLDTTIEVLRGLPLLQAAPTKGWLELVHPEGGRYFHHKDKRLYTDSNIDDPELYKQAMDDVFTITDFIAKNSIYIPENAELVFDICRKENDIHTNYYFVNHDTRGIFFIDSYEPEDVVIDTPGRLRHHVEAQYWYHLSLYPHSLTLKPRLVKELKDIVLFFVADTMTSTMSTSPYETHALYKILDVATNLEKRDCAEANLVGAMCFVSRFMHVFASSRYWNYAGEAHARLASDQSIHGELDTRRSWVIRLLSIVLFFAPNVHFKKLQHMWVDQVVYAASWERMFKNLNSEWQGHILLASIMLNANVGFLSMQGGIFHRNMSMSPIKIASYASMATNIASLVMGLLLVKQTSSKRPWNDANTVQSYLHSRVHPRIGFETLAILYSLPYAFLMWGIVYFLAALSFGCFQNSSDPTRIIIASLCAPTIILSCWSYTSWGKLLPGSTGTVQEAKAYEIDSGNPSLYSATRTKWPLPGRQLIPSILSKLRLHWYASKKQTAV